jgi:hypothetical protein
MEIEKITREDVLAAVSMELEDRIEWVLLMIAHLIALNNLINNAKEFNNMELLEALDDWNNGRCWYHEDDEIDSVLEEFYNEIKE